MSLLQRIPTFESLGLRNFRFLWMGQLASAMGVWMDQLARTWLIYELTHSPLQLGLVSAARGIPLLLFGVVAGVVADRYDRKRQLIIAQTVNSLLNIILATLILTGSVQPWHIYVTGFLAGTVQAFQQPARQVLINDLVGQRQLLNAIALNSGALNLSKSIGPAIAGLLILAFGVHASYYTEAALYAIATLWTLQIRVPQSAGTGTYASNVASRSFLSSTKEGIAYVISHRFILALIILGLAPTVLGMPYISLMPIFAVDVFHGDASTQSLLLAMVGVGAMLGALGMASLGRRGGNGKLLISAAAGFGISLVLFSHSPALPIAMAFTLMAGFLSTSYSSLNQTTIQTLVPSELRGRVLGIYLLDRGLMPLGSVFAGALASFVGGPWAVMAMGTSCFLLAVGIGLLVPKLWRLSLVSGQGG